MHFIANSDLTVIDTRLPDYYRLVINDIVMD